jgi:hypothetical protein
VGEPDLGERNKQDVISFDSFQLSETFWMIKDWKIQNRSEVGGG